MRKQQIGTYHSRERRCFHFSQHKCHICKMPISYKELEVIRDTFAPCIHYGCLVMTDAGITQLIRNNYIYYYNKFGKLENVNDLPAVIYPDGTRLWFYNGEYHRVSNGPTIEYPDGSKYWHKYGTLHRENNLPAIILADGRKYWYKYGIKYIPIIERIKSFFRR